MKSPKGDFVFLFLTARREILLHLYVIHVLGDFEQKNKSR